MYMALDMPFTNPAEATAAIGDIKMYFVGNEKDGFVREGNKRYRQYILLSKDLAKLNNITNALDGSLAFVIDTNSNYRLKGGQWITES